MQRTVLLSEFCLSVCPSVRLSVRCVYCDKTKQRTANILIPHETAITLVFQHQHWLVATPLPSEIWAQNDPPPSKKSRLWQISAHNVSTVRDSEKSSIIMNIKLTSGFPTSYRWSAYVTPKSRKGGSKSDFFRFFWNKSQLQSNKVWYQVSLCVNFQWQSCSTAIPLSNSP